MLRTPNFAKSFSRQPQSRQSQLDYPARTANVQAHAHVVSDCPLAAKHLKQVMQTLETGAAPPSDVVHPIELMAKAYGLIG